MNLVKQQADYIALHTRLNVGQYIGEMKVDGWTKPRWDAELEDHHVLVMTMTIFKNLIMQNFLAFSRVNLLIFDECHHAVKNHDYVQIMRRFNTDPAHAADSMRILGLTASLVPSKCRLGDLERKMEELEKTLCCRSQTAEDLREVAKYATKPTEIKLLYTQSHSDENVLKLKNLLEDPVNFLECFRKERKACLFYEIVKLYLDDCLHILLNLGVWCAHDFARNGLADIEDKIKECRGYFQSEWEKQLIYLGRTHLQMFVQDSERLLRNSGDELHMVDKVKRLLLQLGDSAVCSGEVGICESSGSSSQGTVNKLVGIIFTERRTTAALLCKLLRHQAKKAPDLQHIRSELNVTAGHWPVSV